MRISAHTNSFAHLQVEFFLDTMAEYPSLELVGLNSSIITAKAKSIYPQSSWTASTYDAEVGQFDLVIGNVWMTPQRLQHVTFLPALGEDLEYLYVPTDTEESIGKKLSKPFEPFSPGPHACPHTC